MFNPIAASDGYCPGRTITQRPLKRASSQISQRWPETSTEDARSLKPKRSKLGTVRLAVKVCPAKPSRS